ncbi:MAG: tRNA (N6-threonylcarbamoyladenosine(37)-N6)-methyltransferase TrmO [Asgard group archaeon]|nr:tRNA (N6-threonylcarbamoyladenosine(37)-N6)-methyltransferase TrmO [Asgard group archaeon]
MKGNFEIIPIGVVKRKQEDTWIEIYDDFKDGLLRLDEFSHIITLWWITGRDTKEDRLRLQHHPKVKAIEGLNDFTVLFGVFATRAPGRPNPIGMTIVRVLKIEKNRIYIDRTDAFNDTPIIDIKPYIPNSDCILNVTLPDFFSALIEKRLE